MTTALYLVNYTSISNFDEKTMGYTGCNKPFRSTHPGGALFAYADGHVGLLTDETSLQVLSNLANRDDGNINVE